MRVKIRSITEIEWCIDCIRFFLFSVDFFGRHRPEARCFTASISLVSSVCEPCACRTSAECDWIGDKMYLLLKQTPLPIAGRQNNIHSVSRFPSELKGRPHRTLRRYACSSIRHRQAIMVACCASPTHNSVKKKTNVDFCLYTLSRIVCFSALIVKTNSDTTMPTFYPIVCVCVCAYSLKCRQLCLPMR